MQKIKKQDFKTDKILINQLATLRLDFRTGFSNRGKRHGLKHQNHGVIRERHLLLSRMIKLCVFVLFLLVKKIEEQNGECGENLIEHCRRIIKICLEWRAFGTRYTAFL